MLLAIQLAPIASSRSSHRLVEPIADYFGSTLAESMSRILNIRRAGYGFAYANCVAAGLKIVILEDDVFGGGLLAELLTERGTR